MSLSSPFFFCLRPFELSPPTGGMVLGSERGEGNTTAAMASCGDRNTTQTALSESLLSCHLLGHRRGKASIYHASRRKIVICWIKGNYLKSQVAREVIPEFRHHMFSTGTKPKIFRFSGQPEHMAIQGPELRPPVRHHFCNSTNLLLDSASQPWQLRLQESVAATSR